MSNNNKIPELEVSKIDKLTCKRFEKLIKYSQIKTLSPNIEVWTSSASNKALAYSTHGIFRYFGKFPPPIARYLIKKYTNEDDLVIDPMCGSGTTALEALILNRKAWCCDVNPLSILVSKVKINKINKKEYLNVLNKVIESAKKSKARPINLSGLRDPRHWFLKETILSLSKIKHSIETVKMSNNIKNALTVSFMGIVRRVSRATTQQGRLFLDVETAEKDALPLFEKKAKQIIEPISNLTKTKNKIEISKRSILEKENKIRKLTKLIICHPPYFNIYKYSGINSLELSWLNIDHADIRKEEVREFFKVGKPEKVKDYIDDMERGLINLSYYLEKKGRLALMIGDTTIRGNYIPVIKMLLDKLKSTYTVEKVALRVPRFTEASWAASQRRKTSQVGINLCDFVIILRKR